MTLIERKALLAKQQKAAKKQYLDGKSIREIAANLGVSYGKAHRMLKDQDVVFRGRGGARKGPRRSALGSIPA